MRKLKKSLALAMAACLIWGMTGCGQTETPETQTAGASGQEENQETAGSEETGGEEVTLRFAWWGGDDRHKATLEVIELYESQNPNVTIEAEYQGYDGYNDKILTQLAGGTQPDIMQTIATAAKEYQSSFPDSFVNLDEQDIFDVGMIDENFIEGYCKDNDGNTVAIPTGISSYNMIVNKTVTDAAGVELPENMTWDEFMEYGRQIHAANPDWYMITFNDDGANHLLRSYIRQISGSWTVSDDGTVLSDRDALVQAFSLLQQMFDEGIAEPMETAFAYNEDQDANKKLLNNEIACSYRGSSSIINLDTSGGMVLDAVNIPIDADAEKSGVITQPGQLYMVSNGENQEEALKFLNFMYTDEEAVSILKDCRGVPPVAAARDQLEEEGALDPVVKKAVDLALEKTDEAVPSLSENSEVYGFLFPLMQELCYQTITAEEGADKFLAELPEIVAGVAPQ